MALVVLDNKAPQSRPIRVAINTDKLERVLSIPTACTIECMGPDGCVVHAGYLRAQSAIEDFAMQWGRDRATPHPSWVVYVYEVPEDDKGTKAEEAPKRRVRKRGKGPGPKARVQAPRRRARRRPAR